VSEEATSKRHRSLRPRPRSLRWSDVSRQQVLIVLGVVVAIGFLALVPLAYLVWGTFFDQHGFTLRFFREAYGQYGLAEMGMNSLKFAVGSTLVAVTVGTVLAYLIVRTDAPLKRLMFAASLVPLIIPGVLHTIAWIFLLSPRAGLINNMFEPLLGRPLLDIFSLGGMVLVQGLHLAPLVFLLMVAAFRSMDPALEESALMSGARLRTVFRRITLSLVKPALFAAVLVIAVRSLESFEVPALLGIPGGYWVFTSRIWRALDTYPSRFGQAGAYSMSLLILTSVGVYLYSRLSKRGRAFQTVTGRGFRPRPLELGRARWLATALMLSYVVISVVLPVMILVYSSTQPFFQAPSAHSLSSMSLDNYRHLFDQDLTLRALRNSFVLGVGSATSVMLLMAVASWLVVRTKMPGRWVVDNLAFLPIAIPGLVLGVSLLFVYLRSPVPIYGTLWILFIAFLTTYMPYGMRYATTSMYQISAELEESAQTSGATWWQGFRRVILPLLAPGLVAGWIFIFAASFRELSSAILIYSPGNEVISIRIWEMWRDGSTTELAALGVIIVATLVLLAAVAHRVGARFGIREA